MPAIQAQAPPGEAGIPVRSVCVRRKAAVTGVLKEGAICGRLDRGHDPAVPRFLEKHNHRCHLDPLVHSGIDQRALGAGHSLNTMTLGGMALAVGLVDDATVEIENVHRNLAMKKPIRRAILDGAAQIRGTGVRLDTVVSASSLFPWSFWSGRQPTYVYPLAMAVVCNAGLYFLSRTLVPPWSFTCFCGNPDL